MGQTYYKKADETDGEEDMFIDRVICGEYELLYLDTCLREILGSEANKQVR